MSSCAAVNIPTSLVQVLARCPRCESRNVVDLRKSGLLKHARCGRCGEPLPRRLPMALVGLLVGVVVVVLGGSHLVITAVRSHTASSRQARIQSLINEGRAGEAVELLDDARLPSSEDGILAMQVARSLAEPVLRADRHPAAGSAELDDAYRLGDKLILAHEDDLPELLKVLDEPLRRLQARRVAHDLLAVARAHSKQDPPDMAKVDSALAAAAVMAADAPPDVATAVEVLSLGIRADAVLRRVRRALPGRPAEARALLRKTAARVPTPSASLNVDPPEPPKEVQAMGFGEQVAFVRDAVVRKDEAALWSIISLRPQASWDAAQRAELDAVMARACRALASLEVDEASRAWDPQDRAQRLLRAMTCDEVVPADFVVSARGALAEALTEVARRGGSVEAAISSWSSTFTPQHDRALAALGCLAEARGEPGLAVLAWANVRSDDALALVVDCSAEPLAAWPPPTTPRLDYPSST